MPAQTNTGEANADWARETFILPLSVDDETDESRDMRDMIGGKGRSIARLRALGLPTPPAFVVSSALWTALRESSEAPLPKTLGTMADWDLLEAARADMLTIAFPNGFADALARALESLATEAREIPDGLGRIHQTVRFAVRSSSATEDHARALAPGVFESELRVSADDVANSIRRVLSSALSPGAWAYAAHATLETAAPLDTLMAVLVHAFIPGTSVGIGACDPANGETWVSITEGTLSPEARAQVVAALGRASDEGPVEIEWVAEGDKVTFLQLRPYVAGSRARQPDEQTKISVASATSVALPAPWKWDAAHNPAPLSPAHVGLVEWVDERCEIGIRQRVVDGYLFWKPSDERTATEEAAAEAPADAPRVAFDRLVVETTRQIDALGSEPSLEDALNVFTRAYQTLFGAIAPACVRARVRFEKLAAVHFPDGDVPMATWLAGIPSAATQRTEAAKAIAKAESLPDRQACIANYLAAFGDESARWDVAEPTWRERPEPLFQLVGLARARAVRINDDVPPIGSVAASPTTTARREGLVRDRDACVTLVPATERPMFQSALNAAREAAAIGEDDDAFYARLQALVRRALLLVGRRLHDADRVLEPGDVFYLPLAQTRRLARAAFPDVSSTDLKETVALARAELQAAASRPPIAAQMAVANTTGANPCSADEGTGKFRGVPPHVLRGQAGAPGRTVGRAVHHPATVPLTGNAILIASTLLPTELPLVFPAAIVAETGSPLGHVAAQARERGIPAVVGVAGALSLIPSGALILVDGSRGEITRLDHDQFDAE